MPSHDVMQQPTRNSFRHAADRALQFVGLDSDVLHTLAFRSWTIIAGAAMVVLVPTYLTGVEQGYYYTFASLLTLQIFFELGLSQVILQLVSHELARADQDGSGPLAELFILLRRWYSIAAVAFFLAVSAGGTWFLDRQGALPMANWLGPWICLVLATALNLYLSAMLAVIEGTGNVASVARMRFRQSAAGYLLMWCTLAAGAGLWATPILPIVCVVYSAPWVGANATTRRLRAPAKTRSPMLRSWRREVFPLQWRIALSWIGGYFCFQLLTPLAFTTHGAAEAGRLGITLAVFNAVLSVGMSWVNAKFPAMSMHLARHERAEANNLFWGAATRAVAVTSLASATALVMLGILLHFAPGVAGRFASLPVASCIAVATVANTIVFAAAAYLRAHKEEPMLWVSLVWAAIMLAAVSVGSRWGVLPMMALYMAVTVLVPLPWTLMLFRDYFRRAV